MNMQAIKIGRVLFGQTAPQIIVSAMGGRVMLLDGITGLLITETNDFGLGGLALAVADLTGDGLDEVIFASVYSPIDGVIGGTVRSHLHVFTGSTGQLTELPNANGVKGTPIGIAGNDDFLGYGACGLAIIDHPLITSIQKGILVTTLNGEIAVFAQNNGAINPAAVFRKVVEGSVGAYNSIVIENLDPSSAGGGAKPEVYMAGSSGIRTFDIQ